MDPVSRRLAAAAMGLAFGLSRDEELEKTRLDLERARMEREDFRNGAGPTTEMLQLSQVGWGKEHFARMYAMQLRSDKTVNKRRRTQDNSIVVMREDLASAREELEHAKTLMSSVISEIHRMREVSDSTHNEIIDFLGVRPGDYADSSDDGMVEG